MPFVLLNVLFGIYLVTTGLLRAGIVRMNDVAIATKLLMFPVSCVVGSYVTRM